MNDFELVIGLEVHIKLNSDTKLFCQCKNEQEFENLAPNSNICPFCSAQPGWLPVISQQAVDKAILLWHALGCQVNSKSIFDRKSYFYPDSPSGYQITQNTLPLNTNWKVEFWINNFEEKKSVTIQQAHVECDAWKMIHEWGKAYIDFNRTGSPLVEIVTNPDFRSADEVAEFLKELQRLVRANDVWDADLEKWQMRADVNISIRPKWSAGFWTKVETKNMNSFSAIKRAIEYEYSRQVQAQLDGEKINQETRGWNDEQGYSYTMRSKENALDYRYFPDPDLPPLLVDQAHIDEIKKNLKKPWAQKIEEFKNFWFNKEYINALLWPLGSWFDEAIQKEFDPGLSAKWLVGSLARYLNEWQTLDDFKFSKWQFFDLLDMIRNWAVNDSQAKTIVQIMQETWSDPEKIAEQKWFQPVDENEILAWIDQVIAQNPKAAEDVKNWEMKSIWFLIGQLQKISGWKADPRKAKEMIEAKLKS